MSSGRSAGSSLGSGSSRSARAPASCRTSGRCRDRRRTATSSFARRASTRARSSGCSTTRSGSTDARLAALTRGPPDIDVIDDDGVRHRLWAVPADGELADDVGGADRRRGVRLRHDRRRPPPIRDRAALPRRTAHEPLVRRGPRVRLRADAAAPGRPLRVDRPPDPPPRPGPRRRRPSRRCSPGPRAFFDVDRAVTAADLRARFDAIGRARPAAGSVRALDAHRRADADGAARRLRADLPAGGAASGASTSSCWAWPSSSLLGIGPRRGRRRSGRPTRSRPARRSTGSTTRSDGTSAAFLLEPTPVSVHHGRGRRRRRHAPEVDLLLPEGPDRPRHQPARMVSQLPDQTPDAILAQAQLPPINGRPVRKDEIELHDRGPLHRVVAAGASLATQAAALPARRADRLVAVGAVPRLLRRARLGGPRPQPAQPLLVADGGPGAALVRHVHRGRRRGDRPARDRTPSSIGHGMGGLLALKAAERMSISGIVLLEPGDAARTPAAGPPVRAARDPRGLRSLGHRLGDAPRAPAPGPSGPDPRRCPAHPAPARPEAARGRGRASADARRRLGRPARRRGRPAAGHRCRSGPDRQRPTMPNGWRSGSTRSTSRSGHIRTTGWSSARASFQQVADAIRGFLETHRL